MTHSQLLRILERLEVGQRRRLVQIHDEMRIARDQLYRTQLEIESPQVEDASEAEDANVSTNSDQEGPISDAELKLLFARRALLQSEKSAREIEGVADSFEDIRAQLTNNRVESEQRLNRIQYEVIEPLRKIRTESFETLIEHSQELEKQLEAFQSSSSDAQLALEVNLASDQAIVDVERVLNEIDLVLAKLVKYEDYSELLELVRQVIRDQEELLKQTKNEHNKQGLRDLLDQ